MPVSTTGSGTKQGDHVFNDLASALSRPIESIRGAHVPGFEGSLFLLDYLPFGVDFTRRILHDPLWTSARQYVATPGQEQDALRRLRRVAPNRRALMQISEAKLVHAHLENASLFGHAARRFDFEFLSAMRHALTVAIERPNAPNNSNLIFGDAKPVIAVQTLINAAFDPAAAMIVLIDLADRENALPQGGVLNLIESIWSTIEPRRPSLWPDPWNQFRETKSPAVVNLIYGIRDALNALPALKVTAQSVILQTLSEAASGRRYQADEQKRSADFGYMIAALTTRVEALRASGISSLTA